MQGTSPNRTSSRIGSSVRAAAILLAWLPLLAFAQRSYFELVAPGAGTLDPGEINGLAQDARGFLWLGARVGLIRFDGREFVRWAAPTIDQPVIELYAAADGGVISRTRDGRAFVTTEQGAVAVRGPDGLPLQALRNLAFDSAGTLWCVLGDDDSTRLWRRDTAGEWREVPRSALAGEAPVRVRALADGLGIVTDAGAWIVRERHAPERLLREPGLFTVDGGGVNPYAAVSAARNVLLREERPGGAWREVPRPAARVLDLRYRGHTLWLALDVALLAIEPDGRVRTHDPARGLPAGGTLLVDRERSLWLGTPVGLIHFPEPDTWNYTEADGLPGPHAFDVAVAQGDVWIGTYRGPARIAPATPAASNVALAARGRVCVDAHERVWLAGSDAFHVFAHGRFAAIVPAAAPRWLLDCTLDRDGTLWFATANGAFRLGRDADMPQRLPVAEFPDGVEIVWRGDGDEVWLAHGDRGCRYRVVSAALAPLGCAALPFPDHVHAAAARPGRAWVGSALGLLEFDGEHTRRIAGERTFGGGLHHVAAAARAGGYWAIGYSGALERIVACDACDNGWRAVETIGAWNGVPPGSAKWAAEDAGGNLWIAGIRGIFRVPASARTEPVAAPTILPVSLVVDGVARPPGELVRLASGTHGIDAGFAATSLRDRGRLRFRSRVGGADPGEWSAPTVEPLLHLVALPPGRYRVEMQASLDGLAWSTVPAAVEFDIQPPWYRQPWAYALFALAVLAAFGLAYRLRVASLLRVERERTRIAMDLHDDFGAGIGAIGMLAGVAASSGDDASALRRTAAEIADAATLLGGGLRSLVWSMKSGRAGLRDLGMQLVDHARRLLPGDAPRLSVVLPQEYPPGVVRTDVRRQVLLIALEALHNIARHAQAANVRIELAVDGHDCVLTIADDGRGFDRSAASPGNGLESMQRRARWISAQFELAAEPGRGTRLRLRFLPFASPRMIMPWRP